VPTFAAFSVSKLQLTVIDLTPYVFIVTTELIDGFGITQADLVFTVTLNASPLFGEIPYILGFVADVTTEFFVQL
jgi:hypothetical protein